MNCIIFLFSIIKHSHLVALQPDTARPVAHEPLLPLQHKDWSETVKVVKDWSETVQPVHLLKAIEKS